MASLLSRVCRQLLLASLLLLAACSSTTFFYNRLDFILPWYVDDFAELNGEQEKYLDELLAPFLHWHRAQELPRYLLILDKIGSWTITRFRRLGHRRSHPHTTTSNRKRTDFGQRETPDSSTTDLPQSGSTRLSVVSGFAVVRLGECASRRRRGARGGVGSCRSCGIRGRRV